MANSIKSVERVDGGLAVEFADGTTAFYDEKFLLQNRERSGNRLIVGESDEDWSG